MQIKSLDNVKEVISGWDNILVLMHTKPDGDALGSAYTLTRYLLNQGRKAFIGIEEELFYKYKTFFSKQERDDLFKFYSNIQSQDYDYIIVVDTSSYNLLGLFKEVVLSNLENTLILDHHIVREELEPKNYIRQVSSTSELIFDLIGIDELDFSMAQALYMGIVFDTGQFRHSSANAPVFYKVSQILEKFSLNLEEIYYHLFENETLERKKLMGELSNYIEFYAQGQIAVCYLSMELISKLRAQGVLLTEDDMLDITGVPHSLKGVRVSVMIREKRDQVTFSFRSRCNFDVALFVSELGGGGHKKAAGLKLPHAKYQDIQNKVLLPLERSFLECYPS